MPRNLYRSARFTGLITGSFSRPHLHTQSTPTDPRFHLLRQKMEQAMSQHERQGSPHLSDIYGVETLMPHPQGRLTTEHNRMVLCLNLMVHLAAEHLSTPAEKIVLLLKSHPEAFSSIRHHLDRHLAERNQNKVLDLLVKFCEVLRGLLDQDTPPAPSTPRPVHLKPRKDHGWGTPKGKSSGAPTRKQYPQRTLQQTASIRLELLKMLRKSKTPDPLLLHFLEKHRAKGLLEVLWEHFQHRIEAYSGGRDPQLLGDITLHLTLHLQER